MSKRRYVPLGAAVGIVVALTAAVVVGSSLAAPAKQSATPFKAALVSDVGRFNDKGFNQNQLKGFNMAKKQLKIQGRAVESRTAGEYIPNLTAMARTYRANVVVSAGFLIADATKTVADSFRNTRFAITDYDVAGAPFNGRQSPNVAGSQFATEENSYLVGCLAALVAKREGRRVISVVGGVKIPPVDTFLAGYRAGARKCVSGTRVLIDYSQDFIDQAKCKEKALEQIAEGSRVVFNVAGPCGLGALDAAKERGRWGIGVDVDQSFLGRHILTSAVKRVDLWVFRIIRDVKTGKFRGGVNKNFNLKNKGVAVGKISPRARVPKAWLKRIDTLKRQIIANKINPPKKV